MSPAHVLEPTCKKLKRMLMEGVWRPGQRLEAMRLADELGVSMTPVRDCLNRLVGERLVEMKPGDGYHVPGITEKTLRDMFAVNSALLEFTLAARSEILIDFENQIESENYADRVSIFFDGIASHSKNVIICEIVHSLNERMHIVRSKETVVFPDALEEICEMEKCVKNNVPLRNRLHDYHERRRSNVSKLIDQLQ